MLQDFSFFNRPISPHLTIYVPQQSSAFSIWHRISGVLILLCSFVLVSTLNNLVLCNSQNILFEIYFILYFKVIRIVSLLFLIILFYHLFNGLRHIFWNLDVLLSKQFFTHFTIFIVFIFLIGLLIL
uniref:Succinate:cytochrome c oxidoreductase subunit 3 n=1 Tax=Pterocladia mexicana TaxID=1911544 RepID=A0A1D8X7Q6_9FLOR|nr:succinate:cytochrome c oxidoreductase subunit 3 [Pterocladia mexicana]AOX49062.1 succinate:cytochrome c oxidoreductase subunit 3 [Pterocladia mexicana]